VAAEEFAAGLATTDFIERRKDSLLAQYTDAAADAGLPLPACVAAVLLAHQQMRQHAGRWPDELRGWSSSAVAGRTWRVVIDGVTHGVPLRSTGPDSWDAGGRMLRLVQGDTWRVEVDSLPLPLAWAAATGGVPGCVHFMLGNGDHVAGLAPSVAASKRAVEASHGRIAAPMNGRIAALPVAQGETVKAGQVVAVIEAMKMEHRLLAPHDGVLETVHVGVGDQAVPGQVLVTVAAVAVSAP
jgi:acetyl/propionyl-CoA carboxylase alpha subunit